ncbi:MIP/aquaporin family protein [Streptomyces sp. NPDC028635]|uniref:MIP/aquaporin family protein n=1 Tax=Streptomyces sp. NPDC028635 TaxID=3154800 RepID=UPI0033D88285
MSAPLARRALAEAVGSAALVAMVVGSGIQATELTQDAGVRLLANSLATVFGLGGLIAVFGPVSGAHFNPVVTLAAWLTGRRAPDGPTLRDVAAYLPAQTAGAIGGAVLANAMFARPLVQWSGHDRSAGHLWLGELVATAGLVLLIFGLARTGRAHFAPLAVASYIGAAYWFTSSTSFANPAVTVARAFTDTFAGIAPASVGPFIAAQAAGALVGLALVATVFARPAPTPATPTPAPAEPEATTPAEPVGPAANEPERTAPAEPEPAAPAGL